VLYAASRGKNEKVKKSVGYISHTTPETRSPTDPNITMFNNRTCCYIMTFRPPYCCLKTTITIIHVKNGRFKHTCNDDAGIGRRKQQKLAYSIFTCKFPLSSLLCHDLLTLLRRDRKFTCENTMHFTYNSH